ncbi:MAG TPA: hypothetical protein VFE59_13045 [Trebonia sp.]|nr:hypothetical protein [Trebonia sp.]
MAGGSAIGGSAFGVQRAGLYYLAFRTGISLNIVAAGLPDVWWRFPVLVLSALQDGINEEVLVVGYPDQAGAAGHASRQPTADQPYSQ